MADRIGIIVNGATGRMAKIQHLINYHYMLEQIVAPVAAAANRPRIPNSRLLWPSWNYRVKEGGGIIFDMMPHCLVCLGANYIETALGRSGPTLSRRCGRCLLRNTPAEGWHYRANHVLVVRASGSWRSMASGAPPSPASTIVGSSHAWRRRRRNGVSMRRGRSISTPIGSACRRPNPYVNAFRRQWELFLRRVAEGSLFPWNLQADAAGVQLAELSLQRWQERKWIDVPHVEA